MTGEARYESSIAAVSGGGVSGDSVGVRVGVAMIELMEAAQFEHRLREMVRLAGGIWCGFQDGATAEKRSIIVQEPTTRSTLAIYVSGVRTVEDGQLALKAKRDQFTLAKTAQML